MVWFIFNFDQIVMNFMSQVCSSAEISYNSEKYFSSGP